MGASGVLFCCLAVCSVSFPLFWAVLGLLVGLLFVCVGFFWVVSVNLRRQGLGCDLCRSCLTVFLLVLFVLWRCLV